MTFSDAERRLIEAVQQGDEAHFYNHEIIDADLIRKLMLGVPINDEAGPVPTPCGVRIFGAHIKGRINLNNGRGDKGMAMPGLVLDECVIAEGLDISYAQLGKLSLEKTAISEVRAVRAVIDGEMIANDIHPVNANSYCFISAHSLHVDGDIQLRRAVLRETPKPDLHGTTQFALDLRNVTINGTVYFRDCDCAGTVTLSLARIEGHFSFRNSHIVPREGRNKAIIANDCVIKGAITLRGKDGILEVGGEINIARSQLGAAVFDAAVITPPRIDGSALDMHGCEITGRLTFRNGFRNNGFTDLRGVTVGADLYAGGATFRRGLNAPGLVVGGDCDLNHALTDDDLINLRDARIGRTLNIGGFHTNLDLSRARATTLDDFGECTLGGHIHLDGFVYDRLEKPGPKGAPQRTDIERLKWLSRQGAGYKYHDGWWTAAKHVFWGSPRLYVEQEHYRPQPFVQLSQVLKAQGLDGEARQILKSRQWIEARHFTPGVRWVAKLFGLGFGFGYSSRRAAVVLALYFGLGWLSFFIAEKADLLAYDPLLVAAFASADKENNQAMLPLLEAHAIPSDKLPCNDIDAAYYALDLMVPLIDLHVEEKCEVYQSPGDRSFEVRLPLDKLNAFTSRIGLATAFAPINLAVDIKQGMITAFWRFFHTAYAMLGWLFVSLAILTFSGLLRQKER